MNDQALGVLADRRRRKILTILRGDNPRSETEFTIREFVRETDDPEISEIELYHVHLPKLAEEGFIEWDRDTKTVRRGDSFDDVEVIMDALAGQIH